MVFCDKNNFTFVSIEQWEVQDRTDLHCWFKIITLHCSQETGKQFKPRDKNDILSSKECFVSKALEKKEKRRAKV